MSTFIHDSTRRSHNSNDSFLYDYDSEDPLELNESPTEDPLLQCIELIDEDDYDDDDVCILEESSVVMKLADSKLVTKNKDNANSGVWLANGPVSAANGLSNVSTKNGGSKVSMKTENKKAPDKLNDVSSLLENESGKLTTLQRKSLEVGSELKGSEQKCSNLVTDTNIEKSNKVELKKSSKTSRKNAKVAKKNYEKLTPKSSDSNEKPFNFGQNSLPFSSNISQLQPDASLEDDKMSLSDADISLPSASEVLVLAWKIEIEKQESLLNESKPKGKRKRKVRGCDCKLVCKTLDEDETITDTKRRVNYVTRFACCKLRKAILGHVYYVPVESPKGKSPSTGIGKRKKKDDKPDALQESSKHLKIDEDDYDNEAEDPDLDMDCFDKLIELEFGSQLNEMPNNGTSNC